MSAESGFNISQYQLSEMYLKGWGTKKNIVKSFMWANISSSQGHEESIYKRNQLLTILNSDEVQKGQKLSLDCFSKKLKNC
jgi:TPR repeat protein